MRSAGVVPLKGETVSQLALGFKVTVNGNGGPLFALAIDTVAGAGCWEPKVDVKTTGPCW